MPSDPAAVLAVFAPWLSQLGAVTVAELTVTLPDGQLRTLRAALAPAPLPALVPAAVPVTDLARPAPLPVVPGADLTDKETALLAAAGTAPIPRKTLIKRARLKTNSHSRMLVNGLIARGLLVIDGAGVRLPTGSATGTGAGSGAGAT